MVENIEFDKSKWYIKSNEENKIHKINDKLKEQEFKLDEIFYIVNFFNFRNDYKEKFEKNIKKDGFDDRNEIFLPKEELQQMSILEFLFHIDVIKEMQYFYCTELKHELYSEDERINCRMKCFYLEYFMYFLHLYLTIVLLQKFYQDEKQKEDYNKLENILKILKDCYDKKFKDIFQQRKKNKLMDTIYTHFFKLIDNQVIPSNIV